MEEEQYGNSYGERISQAYDLIGNKLRENPITNTLLALTGTSLGSTKLRPGVIGSATEGQMIKQGTANLRNPAYRNLLGKSIVKQGGQAFIPATAALIASDLVERKAGSVQDEMQRLSDIEESQMQKAGSDLAERLRKLNLIEEQRAFEEGRSPFGGEGGITMGNLDEYFATNPNFSGIGDITLPGEEPRVAPVVQQTPVAPTMEGIDYSSAFAGGQQAVPMPATPEDRGQAVPMSSPGFRPQFEGQTLGQFLRYEDTPEQTTFQALDPQGRLRRYTAPGQLSPEYASYEAESKRVQDMLKNQKPRVGIGTEISDSDRAGGATGGMSITDYRNIAKQELGPGASSQAIRARANQLQREDERKREELESIKAYRESQLTKAERDAEQREKEYNLKLRIYQDEQAKLTPDQVLVQGNAAMSKLYNNQGLTDEDIPALLSYRELMMKNGGDDPLVTLGLDESQTKELLYGSHKLYPSFTKKKDIDKKTARDLLSKGQDKVFRYGTLVDLKELLGESGSSASKPISELPTTIEEMRNLVEIDNLKKQLEAAPARNKKAIQRKIDELTGK